MSDCAVVDSFFSLSLTIPLRHPKMKVTAIITAKYHNLEVDIDFLLNEHLFSTQYFWYNESAQLGLQSESLEQRVPTSTDCEAAHSKTIWFKIAFITVWIRRTETKTWVARKWQNNCNYWFYAKFFSIFLKSILTKTTTITTTVFVKTISFTISIVSKRL